MSTTPLNNFERTAKWLEACGREVNNPRHASVQIGCHLEEMSEFLATLRIDSVGGELVLNRMQNDLAWLARKLTTSQYIAHIPVHKRADALDSLSDSEVTGNGVCYLSAMDKRTADQRVLDANDAKLVDGKPVLGPGGKIQKPEGWTPAQMNDLI